MDQNERKDGHHRKRHARGNKQKMTVSNDPNMVRSFIAISLPEEVRSKVEEIRNHIITKISKSALLSEGKHIQLKWVAPKNYHITLQFLGSVHKKQLQCLHEKMKETLLAQPAFQLYLGYPTKKQGVIEKKQYLGCFPPKKLIPNVLYVGIESKITMQSNGPTDSYKILHQNILSSVQTVEGVKVDRGNCEPTPHITIARISCNFDRNRNQNNSIQDNNSLIQKIAQELQNIFNDGFNHISADSQMKFDVNSVLIYQSSTIKGDLTYTPLFQNNFSNISLSPSLPPAPSQSSNKL